MKKYVNQKRNNFNVYNMSLTLEWGFKSVFHLNLKYNTDIGASFAIALTLLLLPPVIFFPGSVTETFGGGMGVRPIVQHEVSR